MFMSVLMSILCAFLYQRYDSPQSLSFLWSAELQEDRIWSFPGSCWSHPEPECTEVPGSCQESIAVLPKTALWTLYLQISSSKNIDLSQLLLCQYDFGRFAITTCKYYPYPKTFCCQISQRFCLAESELYSCFIYYQIHLWESWVSHLNRVLDGVMFFCFSQHRFLAALHLRVLNHGQIGIINTSQFRSKETEPTCEGGLCWNSMKHM